MFNSLSTALLKFVPRFFFFDLAMVISITFLANFFWTNDMAFEIWKSLTDVNAKDEVKGKNGFGWF